MPVISRLAPSPTGAQHVGNARTYLLAWLSARAQGGRVLLRIENIDSPRVKPWAQQQAIDDLAWLGLDWDDKPVVQTERLALYHSALERLKSAEQVYPCTCTRADIEAAASAPHVGQEPPVYPGTCAQRTAADAATLSGPFAWRFRLAEGVSRAEGKNSRRSVFLDRIAGEQQCDPGRELGDFVIAKGDGTPSYQLAVVVDDHEMGVTEVVRGDDLIPSTHRQLAINRVLGWQPPTYAHVPLVIGPDGRRLAKRHGDTRISLLRENGVPAERLVGLLAWSCGLLSECRPVSASALLEAWDWSRLRTGPFCFTPQMWQSLIDG